MLQDAPFSLFVFLKRLYRELLRLSLQPDVLCGSLKSASPFGGVQGNRIQNLRFQRSEEGTGASIWK